MLRNSPLNFAGGGNFIDELQASLKDKVVVGYYEPFFLGARRSVMLSPGKIISHRLSTFSTCYGFRRDTLRDHFILTSITVPDEPPLFEAVRKNDYSKYNMLQQELPSIDFCFRQFSILHVAAFFLRGEDDSKQVLIDRIFHDYFRGTGSETEMVMVEEAETPLNLIPSPFIMALQTGNILFVKKMFSLFPHLINKPLPSGVSPLTFVIDFIVSISCGYNTIEEFFQLFLCDFEEKIKRVENNYMARNPGIFDHPYSDMFYSLIDDIYSDKEMYEVAKFLYVHGANYF